MVTETKFAKRPVEVLLAEDSPTDVFLIRESLKHSKFGVHIGVAYNGADTLDYLNREGVYSQHPEPDLILLDLNLPKKNGWVVLSEIKRNPRLAQIPVIILTGSSDKADSSRAWILGADLYMIKPLDPSLFTVLVNAIDLLLMERLQREYDEPEA